MLQQAFVWLLVVALLAIPFTLLILGAFTYPGPFAVWVSIFAVIAAMVITWSSCSLPSEAEFAEEVEKRCSRDCFEYYG